MSYQILFSPRFVSFRDALAVDLEFMRGEGRGDTQEEGILIVL